MIIIFGKNGMKLIKPFVIKTDIYGDRSFFEPYMNQMEWTDTNKLYSEHEEYEDTMYGRKMVHHYIKHIEQYDMGLKKYIMRLFKQLGINTKDFRCDFFLTKAGGSMPMHIDGMSKIAILIPLSKNTGALVCEDKTDKLHLVYQTLTILNTQISHGVEEPTEDRLLFRIAVHDVKFEDTGVYKKLT
jgi:hypothetical protein